MKILVAVLIGVLFLRALLPSKQSKQIARLIINAAALIGSLFCIYYWRMYYATSLERTLVWLVAAAVGVVFLSHLLRLRAPKPAASIPDARSEIKLT